MAHREELLQQPETPRTASGLDESDLEPSSDQVEQNRALLENLHLASPSSPTNESESSPQITVSEESRPGREKQGVEVVLPSGWEARKTPDGKAYYMNDITKTTTWIPSTQGE